MKRGWVPVNNMDFMDRMDFVGLGWTVAREPLAGRRGGKDWISWLQAYGFAQRVDRFVELRVAGRVQKRCHASLHRTPRRWRADRAPG